MEQRIQKIEQRNLSGDARELPGAPAGVQNPLEGVPEAEVKLMNETNARMENERAYQQIQGTKPQTLGVGLTDSPAGLASWIVEKFHAWCDCGDNIESRFSKDDLLTKMRVREVLLFGLIVLAAVLALVAPAAMAAELDGARLGFACVNASLVLFLFLLAADARRAGPPAAPARASRSR